jgi:LuxR family maltose regulon positive regulatory protein
MQKTDTLIHTKLHLPFTRLGLVSRPRLQEQITQGLSHPLTLITAPAGFGKTTLVATCVADCGMPVAWLSLDKDDNQAERFLNYLVAALQETDNTIGSEAAQLLAGMQLVPPETVLTSLINDLDALTGEIVLVLDDYQLISSQAVHEEMAFLVENCPNTFHVMIVTRSDPPLPLARLRARGQAVELRVADLRFTEPEAAQFLNDIMGLRLDAESVKLLEERTEGWIAGLQMAALSMRNREDALGFIEGFSGTHRYILDYLLEEVLIGQPPEVQRFLLYTSILERLSAPLCEAVLTNAEGVKEAGGDRSTGQSVSILDYLERENLFLVPLDDERIWYRYHHLFTDLLRARLKQSLPELVPQLHLSASEWFERNGLVAEAIQHNLSTGDYERSADLILKHGSARWSQNDTSIMKLVGNLPPKLLITHPKLGIYQAWILISSGQSQAALTLLATLKEHLHADVSNPSTAWMRAYIDLLHAYVAPEAGITQGPLPDIQVFHAMPEEDIGLHNVADYIYAMLLGRHGELEEPAEILLQCIQRDAAAGGTTAIPLVTPLLARIRLMQGRLHEAAGLCRETLKPLNKKGTKFFYMAGSLHIILGEVLREWNDLDEAEAQIQEGIQVNEPWQMVTADALGYAALARVQEAQGNITGAIATLGRLETMFEDRTKPPDWEGELRSLQVRLWLASGNLTRAVDWARHFPIPPSPNPIQETDLLTAARVRMAEKNFQEAQHLLEALNQAPGIEKRLNRKIKIDLLLACALAGQNQIPRAFQLLETSLTQAEPGGLIRVFLDIGQPMQSLLARWLAHSGSGRERDYAIHLLSKFETEPYLVAAVQEKVPPNGNLVEPLSPRELEVLHLVSSGKTNQEIALQLIVAPGTVKAHTASIYRKLNVSNRTEAVARARQLGILP